MDEMDINETINKLLDDYETNGNNSNLLLILLVLSSTEKIDEAVTKRLENLIKETLIGGENEK